MPTTYRRCFYLDACGQQCENWFGDEIETRLCVDHRETIQGPGGKINEEAKVRYIDLVNDQREYCYHFLSGEAQVQSKSFIFEFLDDSEGTIFHKIDAHIAFIEKVIEDMKARLHSTRAVKTEKMDELSDDERKELRKQKIEKAINPDKPKKTKSFKSDPIGSLAKTGISADKAKAMLEMDDIDSFLEKFNKAKENKANA